MNTLIVYSSKYGCTEQCAKILSEELKGEADLINLKNVKDINISKYDTVIIGGSIYIGKIQKEVAGFCAKNLDILKEKRIGLFICGMQKEEEIQSELNNNFPPELLKIAVAKEHFGGEFRFDKMNFLERMVVRKVSNISSDQSNILRDNINKFAKAMKEAI